METPQPISKDQLRRFTDKLAGDLAFANGNGNNRATQPVYDRMVYKSVGGESYEGASSLVGAFTATAVAAVALLAF